MRRAPVLVALVAVPALGLVAWGWPRPTEAVPSDVGLDDRVPSPRRDAPVVWSGTGAQSAMASSLPRAEEPGPPRTRHEGAIVDDIARLRRKQDALRAEGQPERAALLQQKVDALSRRLAELQARDTGG